MVRYKVINGGGGSSDVLREKAELLSPTDVGYYLIDKDGELSDDPNYLFVFQGDFIN